MRVPSYCFKSNGQQPVYYFRMKVPKDLQPFLRRTELKKSLRTKDKTNAFRLCRQYVATAERHFTELRLKMFQASLDSNTASGNLEHHQLPEMIAGLAPISLIHPPPRVEPEEITMSRLIELYIKEETSKRGHDVASGLEKNLLRFMEIVGDKPISHYTVEDRQRYRDVLLRIPKRVNGPRYIDQSISAILKREYPPEQCLSITSVNHRLTDTATFLNWAVKNNLIENHPFSNAVLKKKTSVDKERPALSDGEIKKLLENLPADQESLSWCILISCLSALRQSEVSALDADDIVQLPDGTWCLDINDRGDKRLKSKNGQRIIPLHSMLLQAGIVQFARSRAGMKLFPDIVPYRGKYGHQVSKDFAKYRKSLGINGAGQTFHGIRHSVISKLWAAGVPEAHTAAIAGHQRGKSESYLRYSKKNDLGPLREAIEAIDYGDIKLAAWLR
jgi:integrase